MRILVSACLIGHNCKYNGGNNLSEKVRRLAERNELIPVCPECLGGLGTPRSPAEIVGGIVTNCEGVCVDAEFRAGAKKALTIAQQNKADLAILQSRSPSCGVKRIYDGSFSGTTIEGSGIFAKMLMEAGFRVIDAEELDDRLVSEIDVV